VVEPGAPVGKVDEKERAGYNRRVPAVDQASRILFYMARNPQPGLSLTEICREVGIHKSKGYSILNTLQAFDLVLREPTAKTYTLGPGLLVLSRAVLDNNDLRYLAAPYLDTLAQETRSTALLGLVNGDRVVVAAKRDTVAEIGVTIGVGHRYHLTWGAHGKVLVGLLPEEEQERILAGERLHFYGQTGSEGVDLSLVREEIEEARRLGYGKDLGQVQAGINAVSAPVFGSTPVPIGCVLVVGTFPASAAAVFGERVVAVAREISSTLGLTMERVI
jgi:IclR family acetate operon transcriptional repressor